MSVLFFWFCWYEFNVCVFPTNLYFEACLLSLVAVGRGLGQSGGR